MSSHLCLMPSLDIVHVCFEHYYDNYFSLKKNANKDYITELKFCFCAIIA